MTKTVMYGNGQDDYYVTTGAQTISNDSLTRVSRDKIRTESQRVKKSQTGLEQISAIPQIKRL